MDRWWNTDCPLFRRSVTDAVGPWTDLRYSQDWEYDSRVGALRTKLIHCPQFVCEQRTHGGPKQTGHGRWLAPPAQVRFFSLLLKHARQAGTPADCPEMRHFARWTFFHARQCGAAGDGQAARALWEISVDAAGAPSRGHRLHRALAVCMGWRSASRLLQWGISAKGGSPGGDSRKMSWME